MKHYLMPIIVRKQLEEKWQEEMPEKQIASLAKEARTTSMKPYKVETNTLNRVSEGTITTMVDDPEKDIVVVEHGAFIHPVPKGGNKKLYEEYSKAMLYKLILGGIEVDGNHFDFYTSSAADLKNGKSRFIRTSVKKTHASEFSFMRKISDFNGRWSANEECKVKATLFSGSEEILNGILVKDVVIVKSIEFDTLFGKTLTLNNDGILNRAEKHQQPIAHFDGQMVIFKRENDNIDIPMCGQGRIGCFKLTWTTVPMWLCRARGRHWGIKLPRYIRDYWGNLRELSKIKAICTEDCVKGLKWFKSFEDLCQSLAAMKADKLRMVREVEESLAEKRNFSRQALQELIFATNDELKDIGERKANKLIKLNTAEGQIEYWSNKSGNIGKIMSAYPDIIAEENIYEDIKTRWLRESNKAMVTPVFDNSHYEQIAEDPIAFIDIVLFGINESNAGCLKRGQCFCSAKHRAKVFGVRHPANLINGRVLTNEKTPWLKVFDGIGTFILPIDDITLTGYWDGDVDGDECFWSTDEMLIKLMKRTIRNLDPLPFVFPHDKAVKTDYPKTRYDWAAQMADLLYNGVKYNLVGKYSNLATKLLTNLTQEGDTNEWVNKAAYAHAMSILCLDFVKTGSLPKKIAKIADDMNKVFKVMPHNQMYMKYSKGFCDETLPESNCVVDRYAKQMRAMVGPLEFKVDVSEFEYDSKMLIYGTVKRIRIVDKTPEIIKLEKLSGFKSKNIKMVYFEELMTMSMNTINKVGLIEGREAAEEIAKWCRNIILSVIKADNNKATSETLSDKECLRWAANMAWRRYSDISEQNMNLRDVNNKARYAMTMLQLFGDIYAENVCLNIAPNNLVSRKHEQNQPAPFAFDNYEPEDSDESDDDIAQIMDNLSEQFSDNTLKKPVDKPASFEDMLANMPKEITQEWLDAYCRAGNPK